MKKIIDKYLMELVYVMTNIFKIIIKHNVSHATKHVYNALVFIIYKIKIFII